MPFFREMKFSRKIFLSIFGMATFTALVISVAIYMTLSSGRSQEFADSYVDHMNLLAKALAGIEDSQAHIALNAAEVIRLQGPLSESRRLEMARYLGVDEINIFSSRKDLIALLPHLPDSAGGNNVYQTPMLKAADGRVGQHTIVASQDGKRLIEVMIDFDDVTLLLKEMAQHDEDNLALEILTPENESLGRIQREDFKDVIPTSEALAWGDGAHWYAGRLIVITSIKNENRPKNRLVASISSRSLQKELKNIQHILILSSLALIALSWIISQILTRLLLEKIEGIRKTLAKITESKNYSERVRVSSNTHSANELEQLGQNLNGMLETLQSHQNLLLEAERDKAKSQIAAQVAHDIRSPLMSMNMALGQIETSSLEPLALIKSAVARIAGIVQKLAAVSAKTQEPTATVEVPKLTLIEPLIASVMNEHRVRKESHQQLSIQGLPSYPQHWGVVQVSEVQTALSNLINNAFEAGASEVQLVFSTEKKEWLLEIKDNGKGIPQDILEKIFERSFTFGKKTGTGLGLFQAQAAIEWNGGSLSVTSEEGRGTTFSLRLPLEKKPSWLPSHIEAPRDQVICFVDDDKNVLNSWKEKVDTLGFTHTHFFASAEDFEAWLQHHPLLADALLVIDQNLGGKTGLQVLSELQIGRRAYLCTTDFDEKSVQDQIKKLNAFLIPKIWISQFEVKVRNS